MELYESIYPVLDNGYHINVLKGNKEQLKEDIYLLEDAFYKICGLKYRGIVRDALNNINIYQCSDGENLNDTLNCILPNMYNSLDKIKRNGEFVTLSNGVKIIFLGPNDDDKFRTLAHEMFVHDLSSVRNEIFKFEDKVYQRLGIKYRDINTDEVKNEILNEGFAVCYEDRLVSEIDESLVNKHIAYGTGQEVAEVIKNNMNERQVFNFLYDGIPIYYFFSKEGNEVLEQISTNLDKKFILYINRDNIEQNIFDMSYDKISREIESDKKELVYQMNKKMGY